MFPASNNLFELSNSSREGIARVKAGDYAYLMESLMLEYYMRTDCELQTIGVGQAFVRKN